MVESSSGRRRVVIVGGGFGGLEAAKRLKKTNAEVVLVDRQNYHLFQPLLYQVATGGLSPANIASPLRYLLRRYRNCEVLMAEVTDFDLTGRKVLLADGELEYDDLIVAAGATHSYFGRDDWRAHAPGLKTIRDATEIRRRIFIAFEAAEREEDPELRRALMTFVVVGGGPTGVELAGALSEIAKHTLKNDFRHIEPEEARILLIEASPHVLGHYPPKLCDRAEKKIETMGIEVQVETKVTNITEEFVQLDGPSGPQEIATKTVLWAAGVAANALGRKLADACGVEVDRAGRVPVNPDLSVGTHKNIFVIGDLASCRDSSGKTLPGLAPVAMQQGSYVAEVISDRLESRSQESGGEPFRYRDRGSMATIGRSAAVAKIGKWEFCGLFAWILWLVIHLLQIVQLQNRLLVLMQWIWNYITFNRSSRIITGEDRVVLVRSKNKAAGDSHSPITADNAMAK